MKLVNELLAKKWPYTEESWSGMPGVPAVSGDRVRRFAFELDYY
jgi:hypothetical protein